MRCTRFLVALALAFCVACDGPSDSPTAGDGPAAGATRPTEGPAPAAERTAVGTPARMTPTAAGREVARVLRVVDGDTIEVDLGGTAERVRYIGVDTPETVDPRRPVGCFGPEASARNTALVEGRSVELEQDVSERDRFGRLLRYVYVAGEAVMVNEQLVREGYALAATFQPDVKYQERLLAAQRAAMDAGRGLWGACQVATATAIPGAAACPLGCVSPPPGCAVKGNISQNTGERIYHVPSGEFYNATVIDASGGERWFCSEDEALANGWRKSLR